MKKIGGREREPEKNRKGSEGKIVEKWRRRGDKFKKLKLKT